MSTAHSEERIGEAWRQHRMNNNAAAIDIFKEILAGDFRERDVLSGVELDACYGLGLAQRASGENGGAIESFKKALKLAESALDAIEKPHIVDGAGDVDDSAADRFLMLGRMIRQRLAEMGQ